MKDVTEIEIIASTNSNNMFETNIKIDDYHVFFRYDRYPKQQWFINLGGRVEIKLDVPTKNKDSYIELYHMVTEFIRDYVKLYRTSIEEELNKEQSSTP